MPGEPVPEFGYDEAECDEFAKFVESVGKKIAAVPVDSSEKVGRDFLGELYGAAEFSDDMARSAGEALEAYRTGNFKMGTAKSEQVYVGLKKMFPKSFDQYLVDKSVAGGDTLENVAWAAGNLKTAADRDIEAPEKIKDGE